MPGVTCPKPACIYLVQSEAVISLTQEAYNRGWLEFHGLPEDVKVMRVRVSEYKSIHCSCKVSQYVDEKNLLF